MTKKRVVNELGWVFRLGFAAAELLSGWWAVGGLRVGCRKGEGRDGNGCMGYQ